MGPIRLIGRMTPINSAPARIGWGSGVAGDPVTGKIGEIGALRMTEQGRVLFRVEAEPFDSPADQDIGHGVAVLLRLFRRLVLSGLKAADDPLHLRIRWIEPVVARLLVAVAVIGQVDVGQELRGQARGLGERILVDLLAEDARGHAAVVAGHLAISAKHEPAEKIAIALRDCLELRRRCVELGRGPVPGMAHGPEFGHAFEELFFLERGRDGIGRAGARNLLPALPAVIVVVANHGGPRIRAPTD